MNESLLIFLTGIVVGTMAYTITWIRWYVERQRREMAEEVRQALVAEWKYMMQHLDNMTTVIDSRLADALARQWDNGVKSRRNP